MKKLIILLFLAASCTVKDPSPENTFSYMGQRLDITNAYIVHQEDITTRTANSFGLSKPVGIPNPTKQQMEFWASRQHLSRYVLVFTGPGVELVTEGGEYAYLSGIGDVIILKLWSSRSELMDGTYTISDLIEDYKAGNAQVFIDKTYGNVPRVGGLQVSSGSLTVDGGSVLMDTELDINFTGTVAAVSDNMLRL